MAVMRLVYLTIEIIVYMHHMQSYTLTHFHFYTTLYVFVVKRVIHIHAYR